MVLALRKSNRILRDLIFTAKHWKSSMTSTSSKTCLWGFIVHKAAPVFANHPLWSQSLWLQFCRLILPQVNYSGEAPHCCIGNVISAFSSSWVTRESPASPLQHLHKPFMCWVESHLTTKLLSCLSPLRSIVYWPVLSRFTVWIIFYFEGGELLFSHACTEYWIWCLGCTLQLKSEFYSA